MNTSSSCCRASPAAFENVDARDFLRAYLPRLTVKQRLYVLAWANGRTAQMAAREGVSENAVVWTARHAIRRLRLIAHGDQAN